MPDERSDNAIVLRARLPLRGRIFRTAKLRQIESRSPDLEKGASGEHSYISGSDITSRIHAYARALSFTRESHRDHGEL